MSITIIKNAELYSPHKMGKCDILIAGSEVAQISKNIDVPSSWNAHIIDASGLIAIPGLIDSHVHIAGAGGEGGPATRTPEMQLSQMLTAGVTTVVGCLGTDGMTRNLESVLMRVKALRAEGVSAWMYTGAYQVPTPTILGDVGKDLALIEEVIGTGEIALSDHRSSGFNLNDLIHLVAHTRVGAMLGGKAGIVNIHMGDAQNPFKPLYDIVEHSELKLKQFLPTHCNRNSYIFEDTKEYGKSGYVDLTTSSYPVFAEFEIKPSVAIVELLKAGVPINHITMSSDACGSLPHFDENGNLVKLETGAMKTLYSELVDAVVNEGLDLEIALQTVTSNVANILKIKRKGGITQGKDADIVLINKKFGIEYYMAMGEVMVNKKQILKKGTYEK
ncbi:MAG: beta-aspartyl-peptidase [Bacteroidales bacterium]|jgi:beta-aspartyl-dipeptidase (metallo-type)|nr:beta-aspartyl-peptidase [Bacteroidales bacterium]MDY0252778.1 beta-aspartyl-peptidase [Tenuifilaceae bacterium]